MRNSTPRRFAQAFTISLAIFLTSGAGLLAYVSRDARPGWLEELAIASATMVAVTFAGWLATSLKALARQRETFTGQGRS